MNILKGIWTGALLWVLIFFEVSILMFGFKLSASNGVGYYAVHYFFVIFLVLLCSFIYFKGELGGLKQGIAVGLTWLIIGLILDLVITIPLFIGFDKIGNFYNVGMIIGMLEGVVLTVLFGLIFGKKFIEEERPHYPRKFVSLDDLKRQVTKTTQSLNRMGSEIKTKKKKKRK